MSRFRLPRNIGLYLVSAIAFLLGSCMTSAHAAESIVIPEVSASYRIPLQRAASEYFGLDAPVATLAAQIHQESHWKPTAASKYAQGLAQFTPATAKWLPSICKELQGFDRWDPVQSVRAMACYDAWLFNRVKPIGNGALTQCDRWAFTLRAYNGGEGWITRERRMALAVNQNANDWIAVKRFNARARWAHKENTTYPVRILLIIQPYYDAAGWTGSVNC